jgi:putative DNA primase/helicase
MKVSSVYTVRKKPEIDFKALKAEIVSRLDMIQEYKALGVVFTATKDTPKGWRECKAYGRDDKDPSAGVNTTTWSYRSHGEGAESLTFWDFAEKYGRLGDFMEVLKHYAQKARVPIPGEGDDASDASDASSPSDPSRNGHHQRPDASDASDASGFATFEQAARLVKGKLENHWVYSDPDGKEVFRIARFAVGGKKGKSYRPFHFDPKAGWVMGDPPGPLPLFNLSALKSRPGETVWVGEGEKVCVKAGLLDLVATTSSHGSCAAGNTDWGPLSGRDVVLLPDQDEPGEKYAAAVLEILAKLEPRPRVRVLRLPDLPEHGDLVDWVQQAPEEWEPGQCRQALEDLAFKVPPVDWGARARAESDQAEGDLVTTRLNTVRPKPLRWLVPGFIPVGKLSLMAGEGGHGKSVSTLTIAADVTQGRPCFGLDYDPGGPADVLLVSCEDDMEDTVLPRLLAAGADVSRVRKVDGIRQKNGRPSLFSMAHYEAMERDLETHPETRLVIIDPVGAFVGRAGVDDHKNSALTALLQPMHDLASRCKVAILLVCHMNKLASAKAVHRIIGGVGYVNTVRVSYILAPDPEDETRKIITPLKVNLGAKESGIAFRVRSLTAEEQAAALAPYGELSDEDRETLARQLFRLAWDGRDFRSADEILSGSNAKPKEDKRAKAVAWLRQTLAKGPVPSDQVITLARAAGFGKDLIWGAKDEAGVRARKGGMKGGWSWELIDPPAEASEASEPSEGSEGSEGSGKRPNDPTFGDVPPDLAKQWLLEYLSVGPIQATATITDAGKAGHPGAIIERIAGNSPEIEVVTEGGVIFWRLVNRPDIGQWTPF